MAVANPLEHGLNAVHCDRPGGRILTSSAKQTLKGTATLLIRLFYMKKLFKTWILIPVSSKSVEKYGSCGRLNICKWTPMEAAIL